MPRRPINPPRVRNVSLARAISKLGLSSRSIAAKLIDGRRVSVNGTIVADPDFRCSLESDVIAIDGAVPPRQKDLYIVMNKPAGIVTTRSDEHGRKTVYDVLGDPGQWIFPVGRLDRDTSGLLILTNDHRLGERLTNPASGIQKTYRVRVAPPLADDHRRVFESGMTLQGERLLPAAVKRRGSDSFELTISEGKNRQIRRMCESLGYAVLSLERIRIGGLRLKGLSPGRWKVLTRDEITALLFPRPAGSRAGTAPRGHAR